MRSFSNIRNVRRLGETPEAYVVELDLHSEDGTTETALHVARENGGGICDDVIAAITAGQYEGAIVDYAPPLPTTAELKARVNRVRADKAAGPFTVQGYAVDTDESSASKITGKALAIQAGLHTGDVYWRMADDVTYAIDPQTFMSIAQGVSAKIEAVYAFSWQLKADIDAGTITTYADIDNAAWPT